MECVKEGVHVRCKSGDGGSLCCLYFFRRLCHRSKNTENVRLDDWFHTRGVLCYLVIHLTKLMANDDGLMIDDGGVAECLVAECQRVVRDGSHGRRLSEDISNYLKGIHGVGWGTY